MKLSVCSPVLELIAEGRRAAAGLKTLDLGEGYPKPGQL